MYLTKSTTPIPEAQKPAAKSGPTGEKSRMLPLDVSRIDHRQLGLDHFAPCERGAISLAAQRSRFELFTGPRRLPLACRRHLQRQDPLADALNELGHAVPAAQPDH